MWTRRCASGRACGAPILFFAEEQRQDCVVQRAEGERPGSVSFCWRKLDSDGRPCSGMRGSQQASTDPTWFCRAGAPRRRETGVGEGLSCMDFPLLFRGSFLEKEFFV